MNRQQIMQTAWALFRSQYHYPAVPFKSLGRGCFGWCLREAHRQAREAALIAAIPAEVKAARIDELQGLRERAAYIASYRQSQARVAEIDRELSGLIAA